MEWCAAVKRNELALHIVGLPILQWCVWVCVCVYAMEYYSAFKKEEILQYMAKPWGPYGKWNKPDIEGQMLMILLRWGT